jgi:predicted transcriptional regulator
MKPEKPSELELQILGLLWRDGPLTAREVLTRTPDGKMRAYTTILSVMQVMEKKGLLTRTREGLTDRWRPTVKESQILGPFMKSLVDRIFGGRAANAMQCLLSDAEVDAGQIQEIRNLLDAHQRGEEKSKRRSKR